MRRVATHPFCDLFLLFNSNRIFIQAPESEHLSSFHGSISANFCIIIFQIQTLMMNVRTLSFIFILLSTLEGFTQQPDTTFVSASVSRAKQIYMGAYKAEWPMNSGSQYVEYASIEGEHPYFISSWSLGSVLYQGDVYTNVSMLLDLRGDRLVIQHALFDVKIELSPEKVKAFTLAGHRFIHIRQDTVKTLPESGYFEVLQSGTVSLIARHQKTIQRSMAQGKAVAILKKINRYYVLKDGTAIPVDSKKSILHALNDQPDLKAQIKKNRIRFGANREAGLAGTVRIYNQLVKMQ